MVPVKSRYCRGMVTRGMVAAVLGCTICVAGPPDAVDGSPAIGLAADPTAGVRGAVDPDRGDADPVAGRADDQHLKSLSKESRGGSEPAARSAAVRKDNKPDPPQDPFAGMTEQQKHQAKMRKEHAEFQEKHAGHAKMHTEMLVILMVTLVLCQCHASVSEGKDIVLVLWKLHYFDSYQLVTLIGMWLIPVYFSVELHFEKWLLSWAIFSLTTAFVTYKATRKPLKQTTPRQVYMYFTVLYKLTFFATFFGYALALIDFLGFGAVVYTVLQIEERHPLMRWGLIIMFYGLYFGVLVRDFAEISAASMASVIGYYTATGVPTKSLRDDVCAICGERTKGDDTEKISKLPCGHHFHEFCIRGWTIIGKKETCPYCNEKVDLKKLFPNPWSLEKQDVLFSQLLDAIRYLVVWQPIIITTVKGINHLLGLQ